MHRIFTSPRRSANFSAQVFDNWRFETSGAVIVVESMSQLPIEIPRSGMMSSAASACMNSSVAG